DYARAWLQVMRGAPTTRFYFYTRSWRVPAIRRALERMAELPNVRAWFSCDHDTGVPASPPPSRRLAWPMADEDDRPPRGDLVFRANRLRSQVQKRVPLPGTPGSAPVCPPENGAAGRRLSCDRCGVCWRPAATAGRRVALPLLGAGEAAP